VTATTTGLALNVCHAILYATLVTILKTVKSGRIMQYFMIWSASASLDMESRDQSVLSAQLICVKLAHSLIELRLNV
jgi:hypothetical protein